MTHNVHAIYIRIERLHLDIQVYECIVRAYNLELYGVVVHVVNAESLVRGAVYSIVCI